MHVDAYRLGGVPELDDLDLDASLDEAVTVVEWGDGVADGSPTPASRSSCCGSAPTSSRPRARPATLLVRAVGPRWAGVDLAVLARRSLELVLLAFDTATPAITVALHDGDGSSPRRPVDATRHGELLAPAITAVLGEAGVPRQDLTAIAVGVGPGPFTGLRVGLVTARTLGLALEIPVYGVCTLDVLAARGRRHRRRRAFLVATDARRKEVYWAPYAGRRRAGRRSARVAARRRGHRAARGGRGALLYPDAFPAPRRPAPRRRVLAEVVVRAERAELLDPEPLYLRRPDAGPPPAQAGLVIRLAATGEDIDSGRGLEVELFAADAWPARLVRGSSAGPRPHSCRSRATRSRRLRVTARRRRRRRHRSAVAPATGRRAGRRSARRGAAAEAAEVLLEVRADNAAARWLLRRHGFEEVDRRRRYYRDGRTPSSWSWEDAPA